MAERILELGARPWFEPSVCIEHVGPTRLIDLMKDQASRGRRQARSDILTRSSGSLRFTVETKSGLLTPAVAMRTVKNVLVRSRFLSRNLKRCAPDRHDLVLTLPWIVLGLIANTSGWAREQYAYAHKGEFTESDGGGPTRAPLRRQITTTGDKVLALTFDDGPSEFTPQVLRVLSKYDVPATFFVLGERMAANPDVVRSLADAGHVVGIHGWSHTAFTELDPAVLAADLCRTAELLQVVTGTECCCIRPPYGIYDGELVSGLADRQLVTWLWTADPRDWSEDNRADQIAKKTLRSLTPGGIVLLHDGGGDRSATVRALPRIIEGAQARGFHFVTLDSVSGTPPQEPT